MRISMPRGDIKWQRFMVNTPNGTATDIDFTSIYFTVKKNKKDRLFLFQKSLKRGEIYKLGAGDYQFKIDAKDTNKLLVGEYIFDIQISYKNLLKESFVGDFILKDEVTFYENEDADDGEVDFSLPQTSEQSSVILTIPDYHILELTTPVEITGADGNYDNLSNIPTINGIPLKGNITLEDLGIQPAGIDVSEPLTPEELEAIVSEKDESEDNDPEALSNEELEQIINS